MEVRAGYTQTEVGLIPQDWEVKKLSAIASVKTGPFGSSLHERDYVDDGTPIITVEHLGESGVVHENLPMVSDFDRERLSAYRLLNEDIVFSRVGSVDRNALISEKEKGWLFSGRLLRIRVSSRSVLPRYLSYYFHQEPTKQRIRSVAVGQTMASLNTQILNDFHIAHPPTVEEQSAIAAALSDADALINSLGKLITKKRNIKQGAIQELLTGKRRLPGFSGEWGTKRLGDVGDFDPDNLLANTPADYEFCYISLEDVDQGTLKGYVEMKYRAAPSRARRRIKKHDILISTVRPNLKSHFLIRADLKNFVCSTGFSVLRCYQAKYNHEYVFYHLFGNVLNRQIESLLAGSNYPAISRSDVQKLLIPMPPTKEEQIAIAQVLSDMEAEIELLEAKLAKTRLIKQGMIQELLTGKRRLV